MCGVAVLLAALTVPLAAHLLAGPSLAVAAAGLVPPAVVPWLLVGAAPRAAAGLAAASVAALLPYWSAWEPLPAAVRAGVLAAPPLALIGLVAARLDRRARAAAGLAAAASLVHLAGYNPFGDVGCAWLCADAGTAPTATRTVVLVSSLLGVAACAVVPDRPAAAVLAVALGIRLWDGADPDLTVAGRVLAPVAVALAAGLLWLRVARRRAAVAGLVRDLSSGAAPATFAMPEADRWVDAAGHEVAAPDDATVIAEPTGPAVALTTPRHTDPAEVVAGLSAGSRLALGNARLLAVTRRRLADLRAGQRRVVAAADAERRRIERDLHDGAQQRLVSAALHLRIARSGTDESAHAGLDAAEEEIRLALAALRHLAHGLVPAGLLDEGLAAALRELGANSDVPAELDIRCPAHLPDHVTLAAYALIAVALGSAAPSRTARIVVAEEGGTLAVRVEMSTDAEDLPERLSDATDRIGAAGGDVKLIDTDRPTVTVEATIPCA